MSAVARNAIGSTTTLSRAFRHARDSLDQPWQRWPSVVRVTSHYSKWINHNLPVNLTITSIYKLRM
uniref:Uncharacterized protein n=1 Tax=Hymenolepis diminuta TaxID=6216 RepID=A0A0R3SVB5_HYMDI